MGQIRLDNATTPLVEEVRRLDSIRLGKPYKRPDGSLVAQAIPVRAGVLTYDLGNGKTRRELVLPEEIAKPLHLQTLQFAPITLDHPPQLIDPDNAQEYTHGTVGNVEVKRGGEYVVCDMVFRTQEIQDALANGIDELSLGYSCTLEHTAGTYKGQKYDAIQRDRKVNHNAVVKEGRVDDTEIRLDAAGTPFIRRDSADATLLHEDSMDPKQLAEAVKALGHDDLMAVVGEALKKHGLHAAKIEREDEEGGKSSMKMDEMKTALDAMMKPIMDEMKALREDMAKYNSDMEHEDEEENEDMDEKRMDSAALRLASPSDYPDAYTWADERADLLTLARQHDIDGKDLSNEGLTREIAKTLAPEGTEEARFDSADFCRAVITMAPKSDEDTRYDSANPDKTPRHISYHSQGLDKFRARLGVK